ncbi:hypothetical protein GGI07_000022 [Coemansia sp. Benny D115]|nr:hypothetical protein GGI07_000022 [Coemansia sp. Benny D115]
MRCVLLANSLVLTLLALGMAAATAAKQQTTKEILDEANRLLERGSFREAIVHYDTAIEKDPQNYLTYFKRATTLLSISKHASAVRDFSKAIELKPDFDQAYYQRARVHLREGNFGGAEEDLGKIGLGTEAAAALVSKSKELLERVMATRETNDKAENARIEGKYAECNAAASKVIRASPLYTPILKTRAACRFGEGDVEGAGADLERLVRINPDDLAALNTLADLHFLAFDEPDRGIERARACLKSDPDNKKCRGTFKRLRELQRRVDKVEQDKAKRKWNACNRAVAPLNGKEGLLADVDGMYVSFVMNAGISGGVPSKLATRLASIACEGYTNTKRWDSVMEHCSRVLEADPDNAAALGSQFDAQLESEQLEQAQATMARLEQVAASGGVNQQKMHERRVKLETQKRLASRKDYYKILEVTKDATQSEIKKAFRKQAHLWHPDRYRGDLSKDEVEEKMADINLAYEVLSDEEKRAGYDRGHDPNDPTAGAGPGGPGGFGGFGGNPFMFQQGGASGGRPFFFQQPGGGGGKQQFSFQFGGPGGFPF